MGQQKFGMQTFNQSLALLVGKKLVTVEEALGRSSDPDELRNMLLSGQGTPRPQTAAR
jgi:twitching motility protein PilT